ncbi:MAG TPA: hypothetical protein VFH73_24910 [Polyangia bacterium]|jgi:hypothetical protein|nr:hypothetical protein [Polyangia bacterium]
MKTIVMKLVFALALVGFSTSVSTAFAGDEKKDEKSDGKDKKADKKKADKGSKDEGPKGGW